MQISAAILCMLMTVLKCKLKRRDMVTREQLEQYGSKKEEIRELKYKLQHLGEDDSMIGNSTIMDYRSGYPRPQSVVGVDLKRYNNKKILYNKKIQVLQEECDRIERFVESIDDSLVRRIFRKYYIDGISQECVAKEVGYSRGRISQIINDFLKD